MNAVVAGLLKIIISFGVWGLGFGVWGLGYTEYGGGGRTMDNFDNRASYHICNLA